MQQARKHFELASACRAKPAAAGLQTTHRPAHASPPTQAAGTLANMAVDFSAVKEQLLRHDGIARFAALADSMTPALRLQGVWGLSSVAYMSTQEVGAWGR